MDPTWSLASWRFVDWAAQSDGEPQLVFVQEQRVMFVDGQRTCTNGNNGLLVQVQAERAPDGKLYILGEFQGTNTHSLLLCSQNVDGDWSWEIVRNSIFSGSSLGMRFDDNGQPEVIHFLGDALGRYVKRLDTWAWQLLHQTAEEGYRGRYSPQHSMNVIIGPESTHVFVAHGADSLTVDYLEISDDSILRFVEAFAGGNNGPARAEFGEAALDAEGNAYQRVQGPYNINDQTRAQHIIRVGSDSSVVSEVIANLIDTPSGSAFTATPDGKLVLVHKHLGQTMRVRTIAPVLK